MITITDRDVLLIPVMDKNPEEKFVHLKLTRELFDKRINDVRMQLIYFESGPEEILGQTLEGYVVLFDNKLYCVDFVNGYLWEYYIVNSRFKDRKLSQFNYPGDNIHAATRVGIINDFLEKEIEGGLAFFERVGTSMDIYSDETTFKNFEKLLVMFKDDNYFDRYKIPNSKFKITEKKEKLVLKDLDLNKYWIPIKSKHDMFAPTYDHPDTIILSGNSDIGEVIFWINELLDEENKIDENSLFMIVDDILYVFNIHEETAWYKKINEEVDGYECIPVLNIVFKDLIPYFFKIVAGGDNYDSARYLELSLLLVGCTNTELCNKILTLDEFIKDVSDIIGYEFKYDIKEV